MESTSNFISQIDKSLVENTFLKLSLGNYLGAEKELKNIFVRKILIKNETKLSFTYHFKTKDIVKNYSKSEAIEILEQNIKNSAFGIFNLFATTNNFQLILNKKRIFELKITPATQVEIQTETHDKPKPRLIQPDKIYLTELKISDNQGVVFKNAQDKYRQINHFIELLSPLIQEMPKLNKINVIDMGSGKGYLTFALYDYLTHNLKKESEIIGIEFRNDLVNICNKVAQKCNFSGLSFKKGTILEADSSKTNVLIALHACDTATDDAIYKGINAKAELIVVAPCCHKQIRKEIEKGKVKNELNFITNHGILLERQAEMVTDGLRALILEYFGYSVKIQQFISDVHTPKNVMITAIRKEQKSERLEIKKTEILEKIKNIKAYFGIEKHHLEKLLI